MDLGINDIISELHSIYVSSRIIMPIFIGIGLIGNVIILIVLSTKTMRCAPVCLLQALAIHDVLNMVYAIYADVYPAVTAYQKAQIFVESLQKVQRAQEMLTTPRPPIDKFNFTAFLNLLRRHPICKNISCDTIFTKTSPDLLLNNNMNKSNIIENEMILTTSPTNLLTTTEKQIRALSREERIDFIIRSIERFIGYNLIYIGILFALCLAGERCFAVLFPLKVGNYLPINRTRILIMVALFVSLIVHTPQLIKEIITVNKNPDVLLTKEEHEKGLILTYRAIYERFYVISSLGLCIIMLILNILLLWKIFSHRKSIESSKHTKGAERNEMNISILIVVLVFFRMPHCVFVILISFLSKELYFGDFSTITRVSVIIRLLYVVQSSLSFIIYCLFAKKFRSVLYSQVNQVLNKLQRIWNNSKKKEPNSPKKMMSFANFLDEVLDVQHENETCL